MSPPTIYSLSREIVTHIALYLRESREDASARTALVSLATTCRYLSEPVLDVMWHTLPDVIPLLLALPADLCTITPEQPPLGPPYDRRKEFILLRDPVPSDFERMSMYARRVKVLGACLIYGVRRPSVAREQHRSYKISDRMWDMLAAHGPTPLLPNLLELHCTRARPHYDPTLPIEDCYPMGRHCSPKIFDFSLGAYPAAKRSAIDIVRSIARFAPNVRELHWFAREGLTDLNGPDLRDLSCLRKIAAKDVVVLPSALWALGTLPQLREVNTRLDFSKPEWNDLDVFPCGRTAALFPALEKLELEVVCIPGIVAFIETITSTSLAYLKMKVRGGKMPDILLTAFCSSIGNSPFRGTLRTLELDMQTGWWKPDPAFLYPTNSNSLRPLLSLQRLQTSSSSTKSRTGDVATDGMNGTSIQKLALLIVRRRRLQVLSLSQTTAYIYTSSKSRSTRAFDTSVLIRSSTGFLLAIWARGGLACINSQRGSALWAILGRLLHAFHSCSLSLS
ncbi:hypothetical protein C8Q70DRAFT_97118 [Cubamyces menziesii]|nr:hypothetical protein C8Q70DRAFT_97118 [Cubamyces menziesii]